MNQKPVDKNPLILKLPVMAITSISHRLSGALLFLLVPASAYFFHLSTCREQAFESVVAMRHDLVMKWGLWGLWCALSFHIFAGIRHLTMDAGWGESRCAARWSAWFIWAIWMANVIGAFCWIVN